MANSKANSVNKRIQRATTKTTQSVPKAKPAQPSNNNALSAVANVNNALQRQQAEHAAIAQRARNRALVEEEKAKRTQVMQDAMNYLVTGQRPSINISAPNPSGRTRQLTHNADAANILNGMREQERKDRYSYLNDPQADKYILESFNRGNPLSKVGGGVSSNARNDGMVDWAKDMVRNQPITDYINERTKNFTSSVEDFVSGYQNPYKQQLNDIDREALAYMTEDEQKEYSYLLGKDSINGTQNAKVFADSVRDRNVYREAERRFRNYQDSSGLGRIAQDVGTSYVAGIDNAVQGATKRFGNFVTGKNEVEGPSVMENLYGMMSESAANSGNKLPVINHTPEEILQNIAFMQGNMAPSQLVGGAAGLAGLSQKIASAAGAASMFPQVAGSAYNETLRDTGDVDKARLYALASGMNEAAGEYFLGGLEDVSGGFVQDWATKNLPKRLAAAEGKNLVTKASHALARALTHPMTEFLLNGAQEGVEEIIQGTVDAILRNAILNENNEVNPLSEDNLYSAFVAALSTLGPNNALPAIAKNMQRNAYGNQTMQVFRDMGYDYQTLADTMPVSEADYTSEYGLVDKQKLQDAQEAQALAQALATKEGAGARIKASENADLAEAISKVQDNYTEHMGNKLRAQDLELKPMRDAEMVENIRGGFDENGKTAFDAISGDKVQKARSFAAYYNTGRFGTEVPENLQQTAREVGLTQEEISSALRAGAADANNLFPTKASAEMKRIAKNIKAKGRKGSVKFDGVDYNSLTTQQKMRVDFSEALLTKGLGMDVIFVQSGVEDGKYQGANGAYQTINGRPTITLDVNAGMNYESDWTGQMSDIKTLLPTVSHELTHFLEKANKDAYQQIAQSVVGALQKSGKYSKGLSFNEILNEERSRLDSVEQRSHTNEDALHEIVARACEDMLSGNKQAVQAFENLDANTKKTISDHIKEIFDNIRDFFEQMLKEYRSGSAEARAIRSNMKEFEKIRDMWNKALGDITETVHAADVVEETTEDQPVQSEFSMRQFAKALDYDLVFNSEGVPFKIVDTETGEAVTHVTVDQMRQTSMGVLVQAALENNTIDSKTADEQLKMFADLMNLTLEYDEASLPMIWQIAGSYLFSSVKTNADAQYATTIDYGTICSKTQALIDVLSETMVKKGRGLTRDEVITAYNKTANQGLSVPCPVCYVFSRWMGVPSLLETMNTCQDRFGKASEAEIQAYIKRMVKEYGNAKAINNEKTKVQNKMETLESNLQKAIADKDLSKQKQIAKETQELQKKLSDLESFNWVTQVRCKPNGTGYTLDRDYNPVPLEVLFDLRKSDDFATRFPKSWKYRTTRGAGMGKAIMPYSGASLGDFIKGNKDRWTDKQNPFVTKNSKTAKSAVARAITRAKAQNLIGGQRFQSTSDYRAEWGIDYLMTFLECQAAGSQVQLYTKVIEAVDLFATAGAEVNLSIMPKDNGYIVHKDGTKELVFSNVTGVDFDAAYKKVQQYDNVQMILVGINDEHIRLAMADDRIGFIIPWHSSGNSKETLKTLMNAVGETLDVGTNVDYSDYQTDKVIDNSPRMQRLRQFRKEIIQGKLWADYKNRQAKVLTAEEQSLLDENSYLADLYERFYQDTSAQEYGIKLNGKQASSIFPYEYWDKSLTVKDADQNGRRFQEYCASLGLQPRFVEKFGNDPGYWKLLIDRSMYNNDGTYHDPSAIDVTNVQVDQMPMEVNSNNYKDQGKIAQATMDTLMALDGAQSDLQAVDTDDSATITEGEIQSDRKQYSLRLVEPVKPSSETWKSGFTTEEAMEVFPNLWNVAAEESDTKNPTSVKVTLSSYRKIYEQLKKEGFDGTIMDASSGLGYGTEAGVEEYGFDVEDIEPYPGERHEPTSRDYSTWDKTYDVVISNAVLNVLPQEQRDAMTVKIGEMLNPGGRAFVNVRSVNDVKAAKSKLALDESNGEYVITNTGSYQKGFTEKELVSYLKDALGDGYTVSPATKKFGSGSNVWAEIQKGDVQYSARNTDDWLGGFDLSDLIADLVESQDEEVEPAKKARAERRVDQAKKKLAELGLSFNGTKTLGWTDERIEKYLDGNHFGSSNPKYAQAYIAYISPSEFLNLTVGSNERTVERLSNETSGMGDVDLSKLDKDYLQPMFLTISDEKATRANVIGHEGRHRMILLGKAGFERVPVLVFNSRNKYDKQAKAALTLKPENQTGGFISRTREVMLRDLIPFSSGNAEIIKERFGSAATDDQYSQRGVDLDQRLDALVEKYGALPKGEKAVRDISVPEQTSDGKRVRRYVRTVLESGVTSDMINEEIKEKILKEGMSYEPITDSSASEYAAGVLRAGGTALAQKEWDRAFNKREITKYDMALGQELLREYAKQGDVENVMKMVDAISTEGTRLGQDIQALRMLKKYATEEPVIGLGYIKKTVDIMNLEAKAKMGKRYKEMVIDQQLAEEYINAKTQDEIDAALGKIYKNLGSQVQKTTGEEITDRLRAWRYSAMLGNPRTHVRNLVGNALFVPAVTMKNAIGAAIESAAGTETKTKSLTVSKAAKRFAAQDVIVMQDVLQGNADKSVRQRIMDERKTFSISAINSLTKLNGDALEYADWIFLRYHYQNALAQYITANKLDVDDLDGKDLAKARQYAVKEAQKATYRDANKLSTWLNQSKEAGPIRFIMEGMLPFKKTPTNILRRGIEYSPAMLVLSIKRGIVDLNQGKITTNEWIDGLASGLTGTAIFGLGMFLASTGAILGGYKDDDDKDKRKLKGEQEYAVKIGNHTYTIDWAAPSALPLFVGVETMSALQSDGNLNFDDIAKSAAKIVDPMINMSMLSGLNDTLDAIAYSDSKLSAIGEEAFFSLLGQFVPTILGQAARTIDTTQRINYQDVNKGMPKNMLYFIEKMQNKIPYMTFSNDPYLDAFGRENTAESRFIAALQNFVSPGYISKIDDDRVVKTVTELQNNTEEKVIPKKMPKYIGQGEERIDLTSAQYTQFQRTAGQLSYNILDSMIADNRYNKLTADEQAKAIKMAYDYAKACGRIEIQPEYEAKIDGDTKKIYNAVNEGKQAYDTILTLLRGDKVTENITATEDKTKKQNTIDAIINSDLTEKEKETVFETEYDSAKLDAWKETGGRTNDFMIYSLSMGNIKGDKKKERTIQYIESLKLNEEQSKILYDVAGYEPEKFSAATIDAKIPEDTDKYLFVSQSKEWTPEQKVEWFKSDSQRTDGKKYQAWKNAGGVDYDYIKYRGDISRYDGLPKKEKKSKVTEYINSTGLNNDKKRVLWTFAGYKESTCPW